MVAHPTPAMSADWSDALKLLSAIPVTRLLLLMLIGVLVLAAALALPIRIAEIDLSTLVTALTGLAVVIIGMQQAKRLEVIRRDVNSNLTTAQEAKDAAQRGEVVALQLVERLERKIAELEGPRESGPDS